MKNIKELIYAAVEENAVVFQELAGGILQARAYDAIESLRPEVGASMFGEAKKMEDDEEDMEDDEEDEDEEMEDEDEMDDKKKSMKEALHPNQQKIDVVDDEKIDAKDFAKLRAMKKNEEVEQIDEIGDTPRGKAALTNLASQRFGRARWAAGVHQAVAGSERHATTTSPHSRLQDKDNTVAHKAAAKVGIKPHEVPSHNYDYDKKGGYGTKVADPAHKLAARNTPKKADVQEVAMPKNAADWQAMINHQIQIAGHPVATDAQFRATTVGKDMSKIASLEPGEDMLQYATAQGGTVKK
jgi:hypothetical protein